MLTAFSPETTYLYCSEITMHQHCHFWNVLYYIYNMHFIVLVLYRKTDSRGPRIEGWTELLFSL